ncbi:MAG: hypothetical protein Fur0041_00290 [Bacteroidia bacterium]
MRSMLRFHFLFLIAATVLVHVAVAQENIKVTEVRTDSFPDLRVYLHIRDPKGFPSGNVSVTDGKENIATRNTEYKKEIRDDGKCVLILVENHYLPSRYPVRMFFQEMLQQTLPGAVGKKDEFAIASFDWHRNGQTVFRETENFTGNVASLQESVKNIKPKADLGNDNQGSDIYQAIAEGLDILEKHNSDKPKFLVVLSDEFYNIYDKQYSSGDLSQKAREKNIPIYTMRYDLGMADKYSLSEVAESSWGEFYNSNSGDFENASKYFLKFLNTAVERSKGHTYIIRYKAESRKDGLAHTALLHLPNTPPLNFTYTAPEPTISEQIKENKLAAVAIVLLLGVAGYMGYASLKKKKVRELREKEEQQKKLRDMEQQQYQAESLLKKQEQQLESLQQQESSRLRAEEEKKRKAVADEERLRLIGEMKSKGAFPRLVVHVNGNTNTIEISEPVFTVGRENGNTLVISHPTVSRRHAEIRYQGGVYLLVDTGSSNGTLLNGGRIRTEVLHDADHIKMGDIDMTFHI